MTTILGISAFYHDSAAALLVDGRIVAAAQEERFTRKKHDSAFPRHAIQYCLQVANIQAADLDYVGYYEKPLLKFDRLLETYLAGAPRGFSSFVQALPVWLKQKLHLPREIRKGLDGQFRKRILFTEHHESHAASAFFPSPFEEAAILTVDGVGEWATASYGIGRGNQIELTHQLNYPHSLGLLYSAFTYFCGFRVNSGEYKLMGLAPYGEPKYVDLIREKLIDLRDDGSFQLDMSYFDYCLGLTMTSAKFERLFGGPPRQAEAPLTQREMDLAASIQQVTEEVILRMVRHVQAETGAENLCLAGGVALNCVANGRIQREGPFKNLWIQPAAGDAGGALGAALFVWYQLLGKSRHVKPDDDQHGSLLGPEFDDPEIERSLREFNAVWSVAANEDQLCDWVVEALANEKVVGWFQGRMEFGPRALGSRSILGDARSPNMQSVMNLKIKYRESFRPFAPTVLREQASRFFEVAPEVESPYMLLVYQVHPDQRVDPGDPAKAADARYDPADPAADQAIVKRVNQVRSTVPAITHVDGSARVQTVDPRRNPRYHKLIARFFQQHDCPMLINTSFNVRGEPIVCTPQDAYRCFMATGMDLLVVGNYVLRKEDQPTAQQHWKEELLERHTLD